MIDDEYYMRLALQMAEGVQGQTGINPTVGCVIVKDGRIVGMGAHLRRGERHAEAHALDMAGAEAEGATVYVTLEPCSHHGRTPPCADRLIREKVARVVVAAQDPNPQVAGSGIARLREHGIAVQSGVLEADSRRLNESFEKYISRGMPFVTLKSACSLDGRIAAKSGDSKWISNELSRMKVHELRHRHQAIMVGIGTVLADDPQLTTRLPVEGRNPIRVVVDAKLQTPVTAALLRDSGRTPVYILAADEASDQRAQALEQAGATIIRCGPGPRIDLSIAMRRLGEREIGSILLEGGGRLNGSMLTTGLVDKVMLFIAPIIVGSGGAQAVFEYTGFDSIAEAWRLDRLQVESVDNNICVTGYPYKPDGKGA